MPSPLVSIIVPVYNAEPYLRRCLDSIKAQSFTDFEAILVDDGSTDKSGVICDEYAEKDCRFVVVHQQNKGVSVARQVGLDSATGNYVIHADPDDWVEGDWLLRLYEEASRSGADMVICDLDKVYSDRTEYHSQQPTSLERYDILSDLLARKNWGSCCNKLVRRACFKKYDIRFHPEMNLWEDLYVICKLLTNNITVAYISQVLYHYDSYNNVNSITRFRKDSHIHSCRIFIDTFEPLLKDERFRESWYHRKLMIKRMIFALKKSEYSLKNTYPEINERLISDIKKQKPYSTDAFIVMSIRGHYKTALLLHRIVQQLRIIKKLLISKEGNN